MAAIWQRVKAVESENILLRKQSVELESQVAELREKNERLSSSSDFSKQQPRGPTSEAAWGVNSILEVASMADPRWDVAGFNEWTNQCQAAWVRVGYLRELHALGQPIPYQQNAPSGALLVGAPPTDVQLYGVNPYTWLGKRAGPSDSKRREPAPDEEIHCDPDGFLLGRIVRYLDQDEAYDDDLVLMYHISAKNFRPNDGDKALHKAYQAGCIRAYTHFRIKSVPILETPDTFEGEPVIERLWGIHEFFISAYCQRIINSKAKQVRPNMTPERLRSAHQHIKHARCFNEEDRETLLKVRAKVFASMEAARDDAVGFDTVCEQSGFRWVRVWFVRKLARRQGGGPPPRCQDLPYGTFVEGRVPADLRHYVVSHSWAAHLHFDPSGKKLRDLAGILDRLQADDDDVVFIDFMSLTQAGGWVPKSYIEHNPGAQRNVVKGSEQEGIMVKMCGRSEAQERRFRFALFETSRLYAFKPSTGPCVIIMPDIEGPEDFPDHGDITLETNTVCSPPRQEYKSAWGFSKSIAYEVSGWPCAEFAVSRKNGTIANADDPAVQRVLAAREWPDDVDAYAKLMDEEAAKPVAFTKKGDREAVRFNFYKYSYRVTE